MFFSKNLYQSLLKGLITSEQLDSLVQSDSSISTFVTKFLTDEEFVKNKKALGIIKNSSLSGLLSAVDPNILSSVTEDVVFAGEWNTTENDTKNIIDTVVSSSGTDVIEEKDLSVYNSTLNGSIRYFKFLTDGTLIIAGFGVIRAYDLSGADITSIVFGTLWGTITNAIVDFDIIDNNIFLQYSSARNLAGYGSRLHKFDINTKTIDTRFRFTGNIQLGSSDNQTRMFVHSSGVLIAATSSNDRDILKINSITGAVIDSRQVGGGGDEILDIDELPNGDIIVVTSSTVQHLQFSTLNPTTSIFGNFGGNQYTGVEVVGDSIFFSTNTPTPSISGLVPSYFNSRILKIDSVFNMSSVVLDTNFKSNLTYIRSFGDELFMGPSVSEIYYSYNPITNTKKNVNTTIREFQNFLGKNNDGIDYSVVSTNVMNNSLQDGTEYNILRNGQPVLDEIIENLGISSNTNAVDVLSDGSLLVGGKYAITNTNSAGGSVIFKIKPDGTLDESFNVFRTGNRTIKQIVARDDGDFLVSFDSAPSLAAPFNTTGYQLSSDLFYFDKNGILVGGLGTVNVVKMKLLPNNHVAVSSGSFNTDYSIDTYIGTKNIQCNYHFIFRGLDSNLEPDIIRLTSSLNNIPQDIAVTGTEPNNFRVHLVGSFGTPYPYYKAWNYNGSSYSVNSLTHTFNGSVISIVPIDETNIDSDLVVSGEFSTLNGVSIDRVSRISGTVNNQHIFGYGINSSVTLSVDLNGNIIVEYSSLKRIFDNLNNELTVFDDKPLQGTSSRYFYTSKGRTFFVTDSGLFEVNPDYTLTAIRSSKKITSENKFFRKELPNGKMFYAGSLAYQGFNFFRLNADGTLDNTFNNQALPLFNNITSQDIKVLNDGKIVISFTELLDQTYKDRNGFFIYDENGNYLDNLRISATSRIDIEEIDAGYLIYGAMSNINVKGKTIFFQAADGKILLFDKNFDYIEQFGINGTRTFKILSDGKILLGMGSAPFIYRYNADLTFDVTFTPPGFSGTVSSIHETTNYIYLAGDFTSPGTRFVRLNKSDGSLDGTFTPGFTPNSAVYGIVPEKDNDTNFYVFGTFSTGYRGIVRYVNETFDATFNANTALGSATVSSLDITTDDTILGTTNISNLLFKSDVANTSLEIYPVNTIDNTNVSSFRVLRIDDSSNSIYIGSSTSNLENRLAKYDFDISKNITKDTNFNVIPSNSVHSIETLTNDEIAVIDDSNNITIFDKNTLESKRLYGANDFGTVNNVSSYDGRNIVTDNNFLYLATNTFFNKIPYGTYKNAVIRSNGSNLNALDVNRITYNGILDDVVPTSKRLFLDLNDNNTILLNQSLGTDIVYSTRYKNLYFSCTNSGIVTVFDEFFNLVSTFDDEIGASEFSGADSRYLYFRNGTGSVTIFDMETLEFITEDYIYLNVTLSNFSNQGMSKYVYNNTFNTRLKVDNIQGGKYLTINDSQNNNFFTTIKVNEYLNIHNLGSKAYILTTVGKGLSFDGGSILTAKTITIPDNLLKSEVNENAISFNTVENLLRVYNISENADGTLNTNEIFTSNSALLTNANIVLKHRKGDKFIFVDTALTDRFYVYTFDAVTPTLVTVNTTFDTSVSTFITRGNDLLIFSDNANTYNHFDYTTLTERNLPTTLGDFIKIDEESNNLFYINIDSIFYSKDDITWIEVKLNDTDNIPFRTLRKYLKSGKSFKNIISTDGFSVS